MHVGASGAAADACVAEHFAALDACAGDDRIGRKMSVPGGDAKPMIEDDDSAITGVLTNVKHHAVGSGVNSGAIVRANVNARVEGAFTRERVEALAKAVRDVAQNW